MFLARSATTWEAASVTASGTPDWASGIVDRISGMPERESGIGDRISGVSDRASGIPDTDPDLRFPIYDLRVITPSQIGEPEFQKEIIHVSGRVEDAGHRYLGTL